MGLAGRKTKQRIGEDPRNLTWSDDSSKFGAKYLQSLGWTSGTGLGVSGEGRTSNLKIHQKLDLMGIGANRRGPDGDDAGWRGGREFEGLLARLNQAQSVDTQDIPINEERVSDNDLAVNHSKGTDSVARRESLEVNDVKGKEASGRKVGDAEQKKKRKRCTTEDEETDAKEAKRRRKEEKREKKEQRKAVKAAKKHKISQNTKSGPGDQAQVAVAHDVRGLVQDAKAAKVTPRYRAHRARNIASKRLAAVSATGMNEILGISSSTSSEQKTVTSSVPFSMLSSPQKHLVRDDEGQTSAPGLSLSPVNGHSEQDISIMGLGVHSAISRGSGFRTAREKTTSESQENDGNDLLRKGGKSVAEYFAEKLRLKSVAKGAPASGRSGRNI